MGVMCGRYAVTTDPATLAAELDAVNEVSALPAADGKPDPRRAGVNFNVAPTSTVMTVVKRHGHELSGDDPRLRIRAMRWGLVPAWAADIGTGPLLFNARAETVATARPFRLSMKNKRCLVPMDGWYEWTTSPEKKKKPFFMSPHDRTRLFMAGIWSVWRPRSSGRADSPEGDSPATPLLSCTIITTAAVGQLRSVHDRMPLIMPYEHWDAWLDPDHSAPADLLLPVAESVASSVEIRPVPPLVNRVANNGPELLATAAETPEQQTLL